MRAHVKIKKVIVSTLLACCLCFTSFLVAEPSSHISKQHAIAVVKENFGGKVLKAKLIKQPNVSFYRVKLLTKKGRVKLVRVDSRTGEILKNRHSH